MVQVVVELVVGEEAAVIAEFEVGGAGVAERVAAAVVVVEVVVVDGSAVVEMDVDPDGW